MSYKCNNQVIKSGVEYFYRGKLSLFNSAIGLIFVLTAAAVQMPGEPPLNLSVPQEITRCDSPAGFNQTMQNLSAGLPREPVGGQNHDGINGELLLVRIKDDLDIIHLVDGAVLWSARQDKVEISETGLGETAYHLVIDRPEGREHLLFAVAHDGIGQLIWSNLVNSVITECYPGSQI